MAKQSLQEKSQTSYPFKQEDDEGKTWEWAKDGALRPRPVKGGCSGNAMAWPWQATPRTPPNDRIRTNAETAARQDPPRRTDLNEWVMPEHGGMPLVTMAETDVTNSVVSRKAVNNHAGFAVHDMDSVDDEYTGANVDHFYGEAKGMDEAGNSVTGFVERNNYLDRL